MNVATQHRLLSLFTIFFLVFSSLFAATTAKADHTSDPTFVTIAGSFQSELGCSGDWQPDCSATFLNYDANDDVWQGTFDIPAGGWEYKAALNQSWDENYGAGAVPNGPNIGLSLAGPTSVKFYYSHHTHWVTDNVNSRIVTAPGSYQQTLGCSGDWDPGCLRSWLQDPDGDGTYSFTTTAIPVGNYEFKVTINESWNENYGAGGTPGGSNIPFTVPANGYIVTFSFVSATNMPSVTVQSPGPQQDNNVEWDGLRHDSRDLLYRTPGGAVPAGTPVLLRFRTYHNDVTGVKVRLFDVNTGNQQIKAMKLVASDVSCYQDLPYTCDFWQSQVNSTPADNLLYRFIITDGTKTVYYADNTPALDGGVGAPSDSVYPYSYALMYYEPGFVAPNWAKNAVIYQIFPDRFRSGRTSNDPHTGDIRYDDPVLKLPWGTLPEGYCRNYADGATNCPWRFDSTPPDWSPTKEAPRGRDYMGGDLKGVDQQLDYLTSLGVNTIYFNPIFDSGSNHGYDTQNYFKVDPYFGTQKDWDNLVKHANQLGMRIVLDGVFNHMSSDSPFFDRYHHYVTVGACESATSIYRAWFTFHDVTPGTGTCVSSTGVADAATYDGWFGFDSIPVLNKSLPAVQSYFLTDPQSVTRTWLNRGASGWRMDVMGDSSFPDGYWETFRQVVKATDPNALILSETWQKDITLLRMLRGDRADSTMNYRLRDAVIGFLTPGNFDSKGFPDSGRPILPSEFAARLAAVREDYPDAAFYSTMNLLDSHDTERLLWAMTPGSETTADKELNAANVAEGKLRQRLASLIQFTMPGAPTIYYGDEVAMTGDDDPDDRRTYPWADLGGSPDTSMFTHYQTLASIRKANQALIDGDLHFLLADDAAGTVAYGRKTTSQAMLVVVNRSDQIRTAEIPVAGYIPDGILFSSLYSVGNGGSFSGTVSRGMLRVDLAPESAWLLGTGAVDLEPTAAPSNLSVTDEGNMQVSLAWGAVSGAAGYNLYRSPVSGGGWVKVNDSPLSSADFTDTGLRNGETFYYVVTALDDAGNESAYSNEASALPHLAIGWANLQWPPTLTHTISATVRTDNVYGQVWIDGYTNQPGPTPGLMAQAGYGPEGSNPAGNAAWTWVDASFNVDAGNNDEFKASFLPQEVGTFDYLYRYSTTNGQTWLYADLNGPIAEGALPNNPGKMTVLPSSDTTPPAAPTNLTVTGASPAAISLGWDANAESDLAGYAVYRDDALIATVNATTTTYTDNAVVEASTYTYYIKAFDTSLNYSDPSNSVTATAEPRTVTVTFNVTVPSTTDATGRSVYIAGTLSRLNGGLPDWDPGATVLTRVDATHWTITLSGYESVQIDYKYTLGSWDYVEKGASCDEIANRQLTLTYGTDGNMIVNDTVLNWRNVAPCGN